jgi:hypothetical protein
MRLASAFIVAPLVLGSDFDGMAVLAPEGADLVGAFGHGAAQEMEE